MRSALLPTLSGLSLLAALPVLAATPPTVEQVKAWTPAEQAAMGVNINKLVPITLLGGEQAYLASVSYSEAPRNYWAGYLLIRPALQQARPLDEFGGQYNEITPLEPYAESQKVVLIGAAGSGQGTSESSYSVVTFSGWAPKSLYSASGSDNSGMCGQMSETYCKGNNVFINALTGPVPVGKLGLVVTDVSYSSPDLETTPAKFTHETQVIIIDKPQR